MIKIKLEINTAEKEYIIDGLRALIFSMDDMIKTLVGNDKEDIMQEKFKIEKLLKRIGGFK